MDKSISLFNLTIEEFIALNKSIISEELERLALSKANSNDVDLIFINEAQKLTGYKKSTIYSKVSKNEMPCTSRKKPLMFSRKGLLEWIHNGKPIKTMAILRRYPKTKK